jgi:hypothetical protein
MRFLKQKTLSQYSAADDALMIYDNRDLATHTQNGGRAVMDITGALRLPKGTTDQRPKLSGVRTPNGPNGYIRYNTTTNAVEAYINSTWEVVKSSSSSAIQVNKFAANGTETTFGPLSSNTDYRTSYTGSDYNLMVLVDNVIQIGSSNSAGVGNYTVVKRQSGSFVAGSYTAGPFSASGPGTYTNDEYYIQFPSAVPHFDGSGNPIYVTVFYGYGN